MKPYAYLLAVLAVAGCAQSSPTAIPSAGTSSNAASLAPAKKSGPQYAIAIVLPAQRRPDAKAAHVESVKTVSTVGRRQYHKVLEAPVASDCSYGKSSGFTGCEIISESTMTLKKATFTLYSKANAKGCTVAIATYSGAIVVNGPISLTFKPHKKC